MQESVLVYRNFLYLKVSAAAAGASLFAYVWHTPLGQPNGGTWLGYTLGVVSLGIVIWLAWYGIRKRRYGVGRARLEDWLSAHVYLGLALVVIATLHAGFQVGWNVHTLAYVLMLLVIASGAFGIYTYVRIPGLITANRAGLTLEQIMALIAELHEDCRKVAVTLGDEINELVQRSAEESHIGGNVWQQLSGRDPLCPTAEALVRVRAIARDLPQAQSENGRKLVLLLARQSELLGQARRDVRFKALIDVWLFVHVPMTLALLAALAAHVVSVFFYW
ncbi:MAG: hypothetical protein EXQ86_03655 [Rhodospirillales bacterium]|nr:hypothetical protein [Rhodospirillales bacterium]